MFGSTLEDRPVYNTTDCFETFPFPVNIESLEELENAGREFVSFRSGLMLERNEGLTKTYNRFHDPEESCQKILELRKRHFDLDQLTFNAYNWNDIKPEYDFILDYEGDEESAGDNRTKKKPYRYKFKQELHDEVLSRLLKLNHDRYEEEVRLGLHKR
jgi:hypothetical protein